MCPCERRCAHAIQARVPVNQQMHINARSNPLRESSASIQEGTTSRFFTPTTLVNRKLLSSNWGIAARPPFVEGEIRHLLEGARANLVQSGYSLSMWPFATQHNAVATNILPQLSGNDSPWHLRFNQTFDEVKIPFGAKILFWNNADIQ